MMTTHQLWRDLTWLSIDEPTDTDVQKLREDHQISAKYLSYMKDSRERARFDYDAQQQCGLLIYRSINREERAAGQTNYYDTVPLCFIFRGKTLITVTHRKNRYVTSVLKQIVTELQERQLEDSLFLLVFRLLFQLNEDYLDRIDDMSKIRESLEHYGKRPSNRQIAQLSELDKRLVYLRTAANNNVIAIQQLQVMSDADDDPLQISTAEMQHLGDLQIEVEQSREMANIAAEIVERTTSSYNNLLDNSLNNTMRIMTVWSLALAVPPIVSGFWGMNMKLPLTGESWAWELSIGLSIVPIVGLLWYLIRHRDL